MKSKDEQLKELQEADAGQNSSAVVNEETHGAIPAPDDGGHARSAAAHLGGTVHDHTKPEGNLRQGSAPGARREPPMVVQRVGKQHR